MGVVWTFFLSPIISLSPSLWETARYRLKYCFKGPLNKKKTLVQNVFIFLVFLLLMAAVTGATGFSSMNFLSGMQPVDMPENSFACPLGQVSLVSLSQTTLRSPLRHVLTHT